MTGDMGRNERKEEQRSVNLVRARSSFRSDPLWRNSAARRRQTALIWGTRSCADLGPGDLSARRGDGEGDEHPCVLGRPWNPVAKTEVRRLDFDNV